MELYRSLPAIDVVSRKRARRWGRRWNIRSNRQDLRVYIRISRLFSSICYCFREPHDVNIVQSNCKLSNSKKNGTSTITCHFVSAACWLGHSLCRPYSRACQWHWLSALGICRESSGLAWCQLSLFRRYAFIIYSKSSSCPQTNGNIKLTDLIL